MTHDEADIRPETYALDALIRDGLTTVELVVQHDRPNKKLYHVTDDGLAELRRWLATPPAPRATNRLKARRR